jgi:hypothetical protein
VHLVDFLPLGAKLRSRWKLEAEVAELVEVRYIGEELHRLVEEAQALQLEEALLYTENQQVTDNIPQANKPSEEVVVVQFSSLLS